MPAEPLTRADMMARKRAADARIAEAARRHDANSRAREADQLRLEAEARTRLTAALERHLAQRKDALDTQVLSVLDPVTLARQPKRIIRDIAIAHGVTAAEITGPGRTAPVLKARFAAIAAVAEARPDLSLPALGRVFGDRDHTSILHALKAVHGGGYRHRAGEPTEKKHRASAPLTKLCHQPTGIGRRVLPHSTGAR